MTKSKDRRGLRWSILGLTTAAVAAVAATGWLSSNADMASIQKAVRLRFPNVRQISTDRLAADLEYGPAPILLDVRTRDEFEVSHLPGARHVLPDGEPPQWLIDLPRSTPIVAYCAVGYRSSAYVQRLFEAGFAAAENLEGSIFAWANENRPLVRGDRPVSEVHPYDETWGRLLNEDKRAELPAP